MNEEDSDVKQSGPLFLSVGIFQSPSCVKSAKMLTIWVQNLNDAKIYLHVVFIMWSQIGPECHQRENIGLVNIRPKLFHGRVKWVA